LKLFGNTKEPFSSKDKINFMAFGGLQGVGMNCYAYEYDGEWIVIDCGVAMEDMTGANPDQILPDLSYLEDKNVKALLLTHWHADHYAAIPYVWKKYLNCPVYGTPMSLGKLQDGLKGDFKDQDLKIPMKTINPEGERIKIGKFDIEFIHITHLTPQSSMICLRTPAATMLHTGDWTFNPGPVVEPATNFERLKEIGKEGVTGLIGDSTEVYRQTATHGEDEVHAELTKVMKQYKKKIFTTAFSSSTGRMQGIYEAAKANGRKVALIGRSIEENVKLAKSCGFLNKCDFIAPKDAAKLPDNKVCYIVTGCQGEKLAASTRLLNDNIKGVSFNEGDAMIFSSSVIPGNDKDVFYLYAKVIEKGGELFTITDSDFIHTHGHAGREDFIHFYKDLVLPESMIPMHGDKMSQLLHMKLAKELGVKTSFMVKNGDVVSFSKKKPAEIVDVVHTGEIAVEGNRWLPLNADTFKNRKKVFYEGAVITTIAIDKKGYLKDAPIVSSLGVFEDDQTGMIAKNVALAISQQFKELSPAERKSEQNLRQNIHSAVRKGLKGHINSFKKPKIVVHFVYK